MTIVMRLVVGIVRTTGLLLLTMLVAVLMLPAWLCAVVADGWVWLERRYGEAEN